VVADVAATGTISPQKLATWAKLVVEFRNFWRLAPGTTEELAELVPLLHTDGVLYSYSGCRTPRCRNYTELGDGIVKMTDAVTDYLSWCGVHGYSKATLRARRYYLASFLSFLDERELFDVESVTASVLDSYQRHLYTRRRQTVCRSRFARRPNGSSCEGLFAWLTRVGRSLRPRLSLVLPKVEHRVRSRAQH